MLLYSNGASIALKLIIFRTQLYSQAARNISTLMAGKMDKISSECSRQVIGLSTGLFTTLEPIQALHFALLEALSMVKKSLLPSIQSS